MPAFIKILFSQKFRILLFLTFGSVAAFAQRPIRNPLQNLGNLSGGIPGQNKIGGQGGQKDTIGFQHRNDLADSITISYRYLDSLNRGKLDSSVNDFRTYYTVPPNYQTLGNNGTAAFPVLFSPETSIGFNPGFHALDVYQFTVANTKLYNTTRPFTSLTFLQDYSTKEQIIGALHTQNIKPNWNAGIEYRLISSPGQFQNQNTNHNNYCFFSSYQGRKKRYAIDLIILGNKQIAAENGGITDLASLSNPDMKRRFTVPVNLGNNSSLSTFMVFNSGISVGNRYNNFEVLLRQHYDLGKKDSIQINDSTKEYLYYPRIRFQHTATYQQMAYKFIDNFNNYASAEGDSLFFSRNYNLTINPNAISLYFLDKWELFSNDFIIRQFPEMKNQSQFIEAGIRFENYTGSFTRPFIPRYQFEIFPSPPNIRQYFNTELHGEYRNKTRNHKWDASLSGSLYLAGFYAGDFRAAASVARFINPKWGNIKLSFENFSRSPSFIFQANSAFNLDSTSLTKKENITIATFQAGNPRFQLMFRNISIANYAYLTNYYQKDQYPGLISLFQGTISTKNKIVGHLNLYSDFIVQQTASKTPIRVPLVYTRQRVAFEGTFFKKLNLSTGLDISYNTPYKANNYSPILGRFFAQDTLTIKNLPTVDLFFNFRIRSFTMYVVGENLNTLQFKNEFGFTNNNFAAPYYPIPGLLIRLGIRWYMVN